MSVTGDTAWRLIVSGRCSASFNMALDEAVATVVRKGMARPTLRLYGWVRPSVSIGCFQKAADVSLDYCAEARIPVVRRPTGGRAILHDDELTYAFSAPLGIAPFSKGLMESYRALGSAIRLALQRLKIDAEWKAEREKGTVLAGTPSCFKSVSYGEILVNGRKAVGSAQKRWDDGLLQQGSMPYTYDEDRLAGVFRGTGGLPHRAVMIGLRQAMPCLEEEALKSAMAAAFADVFGVRFEAAPPSPEELSLALQLESEKYLQRRWTLQR
jgi:lipoate-protein ligase A